MAESTVDQEGRIEAMLVFDKHAYPGEAAIIAAWHDLGAFCASHPVLKKASTRRVELYIGGESDD